MPGEAPTTKQRTDECAMVWDGGDLGGPRRRSLVERLERGGSVAAKGERELGWLERLFFFRVGIA